MLLHPRRTTRTTRDLQKEQDVHRRVWKRAKKNYTTLLHSSCRSEWICII